MRQLRACDFCGDDPTGVYEVLPASLAPTETEQRRVALCADCRDTLESVLEPLLARLDGDPASNSPASGSDADADPNTVAKLTPKTPADPEEAPDPDGGDADGTPSEREAVREEVRRIAPRADRPPGYDKVLRLLGNREEAMKRDDLRALATNAYGFGDDEFDAVVDAAVENGDLTENGKGLRPT